MKTFKCKYCNSLIEQGSFVNMGAAMASHYAKCKCNLNYKKYIEDKVKAGKLGGKVWREHCKKIKDEDESKRSEYTFICRRCNKEFQKSLTPREFKIYNRKEYKFCSRACANSHSNRTDESLKKVKLSVMKRNYEMNNHGCSTFEEYLLYRDKVKAGKVCSYPGCNNRIKFNNKTGFCRKHLKFDKELRKIRSEATKKCIKDGKISGWKTRNIISYPEQFWQTVLNNNHIKYEFNFPIKKQSLGFEDSCSVICYFLDFKIGKNIDLEIDGSQHLDEDRKEHDKIRDEALIKHGWKVYRIPWNEINSDSGKEEMKKKIDDFLAWYKLQL